MDMWTGNKHILLYWKSIKVVNMTWLY